MTEDMLSSKLNQIFRVGTVVARSESNMRVQVKCPDTVGAALVTDWLPVLCPRASSDLAYDLPDVGDQVLCAFLPNGLERGFVLGSMYGAQATPVASGDKWHRTFRDGAVLEYDRASHTLTASLPSGGKIEGSCTTAEIQCESSFSATSPTILLNGAITTSSKEGGNGTFKINGTVEVTQDVVANGVSLVSHVHSGVQAGGDNTEAPVK